MSICSQIEEDDTRGFSYLGPKTSLLPGYRPEVELSRKITRPSSDASMMRLLTTYSQFKAEYQCLNFLHQSLRQ